jgi:hypothetical protein
MKGALGVLISIVLITVPHDALAIPKAGSTCSKVGATSINAGKKYTCIKSGRKLIWNKGVVIPKSIPPATPLMSPNPTKTPAPTPLPTPTRSLDNLEFAWQITPTRLSKQGTIVDPDPTSLQDGGRNSSFVVRATVDGQPISGLKIEWKTSDSTGQIEASSEVTDENGLSRSWYITGMNTTQTISVIEPKTKKNLSIEISNLNQATPTLGRPVVLGIKPPLKSADIAKVSVKATIVTNPLNTYYAFANFDNFYTGVQMVDCDNWGLFDLVCNPSRGEFKGHEAHFSVWDGLDQNGKVLQPKVVETPSTTKCTPFSHEGSGRMCFASLDWKNGSPIEIIMEKIPGAPDNYQRLRVQAKLSSNETQLIAVIDAPGGVRLNKEFASFNENWALNQSASCMDIPMRSFIVERVTFTDILGNELKPSSGYAYGNVVADGQTLCANWGVRDTPSGVEVFSGGSNRWIDIAPATFWRANGYFIDNNQATIMIRDLKLIGLSN